MAGSYLALDLSGSTGWAKWSPEKGYESGEFEVIGKSLGAYALSFSRWLAPTLIGVTDVYIEGLYIGKKIKPDDIFKLAGLRWEVAKACQQRQITCHEPVSPGEWRSHFLKVTTAPASVKGDARRRAWLKQRCIMECRARGWKVLSKDDNQADALGILDFMRCKLDPTYGVDSTPLFRSA